MGITGIALQALRSTQALCHNIAKEKGWYDGAMMDQEDLLHHLEIAGRIGNIHGEVSEAFEELRKGPQCYELYYNEDGEKPDKPEGLVVELADTVIRIFDLCEALNLDLAGAIARKMEYNRGRSHRHGDKKL